jgi:NADH-quinone oxidoreductase subunit A
VGLNYVLRFTESSQTRGFGEAVYSGSGKGACGRAAYCLGGAAGLTRGRPEGRGAPTDSRLPRAACCIAKCAARDHNAPDGGTSPNGDAPNRNGNGMEALLTSYLPIILFVGVCIFIGGALLFVPFVVAYKNPDPEKLSAYECGFNAFDDARMKFDVRFYLVAILFIIFDLEVAFLFPWAVSFGGLGWFGYTSMMIFLGVLTIGFIYEWKKGALEWD